MYLSSLFIIFSSSSPSPSSPLSLSFSQSPLHVNDSLLEPGGTDLVNGEGGGVGGRAERLSTPFDSGSSKKYSNCIDWFYTYMSSLFLSLCPSFVLTSLSLYICLSSSSPSPSLPSSPSVTVLVSYHQLRSLLTGPAVRQ